MSKAWWKSSVIYQIYPRSFADSNGDGIGDLNGITEHLDYLKKLGVDVIWLSPIYKSPNDDNGYDISDYQDIMTDFGTMEDFDRMITEMHKRGIKLVMDLVVNHSSDEHRWFLESKKSKDNPYRDYYIWKDPKDGKEPTNWGACFGGSAWQFDETTGMYYLHCFSKKQPDLNWENPAVRDEVFRMMTWWCEKGVDGFRMDVISMISKDPAYPDGEIKDGLHGDMSPYVCNGPHVHEYLQEMNKRVLSRFDLITVGETPGVTTEEAKKYANLDGSELNMVFQFEHMGTTDGKYGKWTTRKPEMKKVRAVMNKWQTELEGKAWNSLYWDNHDQPRAVSRFGDDSPMYREISAKMIATCLHMLKGSPYIYQGEEIGMTNPHYTSIEQYADVESRNYYEILLNEGKTKEEALEILAARSRDNSRTPMQWTDERYCGFSDTKPWIPVSDNFEKINVKKQKQDRDSILEFYKKLIMLRKEKEVIARGNIEFMEVENAGVLAYTRCLDKQKLLVCCNFRDVESQMEFTQEWKSGRKILGNYEENHKNNYKVLTLRPYEIIVLEKGEE